MYHYIAITGHSTGWNVAYYIVNIVRAAATRAHAARHAMRALRVARARQSHL